MIIGFDASRVFVGERTGTENYSFQLLKALFKIDKNNKYVVYLRPPIPSTIVEHIGKYPKNFKFIEIPWSRLWTQGGLALQTFKDKLGVLFVPAHTLPIIRKPGLKTVMTVHDLGAEYLPKMHQLKQLFYLKWFTYFQLKGATKLIAVSNATKQDLVKKVGIGPKKIAVIYEGYDQKLFKPIDGGPLVNTLKYYDLETRNYFLFVGTVQPRKNLERLIEAFAKWSSSSGPVNLVIIGAKGWLADPIYQLPQKLGIEELVKFLGRVEDQDLPKWYSGALALTFPSLFEGFGLPILEAQACGCPVLTSNVSSMPEVAGKGALYINPYSVDDIIRGMREIGKEKVKTRLIKLGFENIKRFSWEKCARETIAVLEETAKN